MTAHHAWPEPLQTSAAEFLLTFTRCAHEAGYPTADLEERLLFLARHSTCPARRSPRRRPSWKCRSERSPSSGRFSLRVSPRAVDLDAIARLDDLVQDIVDGKTHASARGSELRA